MVGVLQMLKVTTYESSKSKAIPEVWHIHEDIGSFAGCS